MSARLLLSIPLILILVWKLFKAVDEGADQISDFDPRFSSIIRVDTPDTVEGR